MVHGTGSKPGQEVCTRKSDASAKANCHRLMRWLRRVVALLGLVPCASAFAQHVDFQWRADDLRRHQRAFAAPREMLARGLSDLAEASSRDDASGAANALLDAATAAIWLPTADADRVLVQIPTVLGKLRGGSHDAGLQTDLLAYQALNLLAADRLPEAATVVADAEVVMNAAADPGHRSTLELAHALLVLLRNDADAALRLLAPAYEHAPHDFARAHVLMWQAAVSRRSSNFYYDSVRDSWRIARQANALVPKAAYPTFGAVSVSVLMQCEAVVGEQESAWQHGLLLSTLVGDLQAREQLHFGDMGMTRVLAQFRRQDFALAVELGRRRVLLTWGLIAVGVAACILLTVLFMQVRQKRRLSGISSQLQARHIALEQTSRSYTRLLAASCHDLREPAHALGIQAEMAVASHESAVPGDTEGYLRSIRHCSMKLTDMLGELLDLTRLEGSHYVPEPRIVVLDDLFDDLRMQFAETAARNDLMLEVARTGLCVRCDAHLLRRILFSLVASALKHTEAGQVRVSAVRIGEDRVQLRIRDTCHALTAARLEALLAGHRDLSTERPPGEDIGIGLAVVRRAADLLELGLSVSARPEGGNLVALMLELAERPTAASPGEPASVEGVPHVDDYPGTIALLEDDFESRQALSALLMHWGYLVVAAGSAKELGGLLAAQGNPTPALLITDLHLGDLDGIEEARIVRSWPGCGQLPVLLITGDPDAAVAPRVAAANVSIGHKPLLPRQLLARIQAAAKAPVAADARGVA